MRIIAGKFRSRQLKPFKSLKLRPTSDMLRETLFNILGPRVEGSRFLDLFAGTGAVGIEAVSRGAEFVAFVESHSATVRLLRENLALLGIVSGARVLASDASEAIAKLDGARPPGASFHFVFLDPPYANERDYHTVLHALEKSTLLAGGALLIAEHRKQFDLPSTFGRLEKFRTLRQGDAALSFYRNP